jgi:glycosyltransferase involved in cell wall biosynthesis
MSDITLILEGTYPYITGGVSTCVHQLIQESKNITFNIVYIGASQGQSLERKYDIPPNVESISEIFLYDYDIPEKEIQLSKKLDFRLLKDFHAQLDTFNPKLFFSVYNEFFVKHDVDPIDFFRSKEVWEYLDLQYKRKFSYRNAPSFIDFFYTWRFTHYPLFTLLKASIPKSRVYHSFCTGYAGFLASVLKYKYNSSMILSEHGIYTREREIEIFQSDWIYSGKKVIQAKKENSFFRSWWNSLFNYLSLMTYKNADYITTLYSGNKDLQIKYGAEREKIRIIPNGIDLNKVDQLKIKPKTKINEVYLIGRVVPIKDIKTFIKAASSVIKENDNFKFFVLGPTDEDEEYYNECLQLRDFYKLQDKLEFTGKVNVKEYLQRASLVVLTSISEGQPMVILEAFAHKVPCIATNVGSCKELLKGSDEIGDYLGDAGKVVPLGSYEKVAQAILEIGLNKDMAVAFGQTGYKRVQKFYQEKDNILSYSKIYEELKYKAV